MISPWQQYDTTPSWKFPLTLDGSPLSVSSLSPSNFQIILHPTSGGQEIVGTGTFSNLIASDTTLGGNPPSIVYHPARDDVSVTGTFRVWIVITSNSGEQQSLSAGYMVIQSR